MKRAPVDRLLVWAHMLTSPDIRSIRAAAGLTQQQAADAAGLASRERWAEYESGVRCPEQVRWDWFLVRVGMHPDFTLRRRLKK